MKRLQGVRDTQFALLESNADGDGTICLSGPSQNYVYRHFDRNGTLLYVGRTDDPARRLNEHRRNSHWFSEIAQVTVQPPFATESEATKVERFAILNESPLWNKVRLPVERELKVLFQARLPESLHKKLAWLSKTLPGKRSIHEILLAGTTMIAHQLMVELATKEGTTLEELINRMEAEIRSENSELNHDQKRTPVRYR